MPTSIASFGFRHGGGPSGNNALVIDVRPHFGRNPFHNKKLRQLRGDHPDVEADIKKTPNFHENYLKLKARIEAYTGDHVWLGCTGGHHRSVYLAERLGRELNLFVFHRDYNKK